MVADAALFLFWTSFGGERELPQEWGSVIGAQFLRPIRMQSWVFRMSAILTASQIPTAVRATVKARAAALAHIRWRKSSGSAERLSWADAFSPDRL